MTIAQSVTTCGRGRARICCSLTTCRPTVCLALLSRASSQILISISQMRKLRLIRVKSKLCWVKFQLGRGRAGIRTQPLLFPYCQWFPNFAAYKNH